MYLPVNVITKKEHFKAIVRTRNDTHTHKCAYESNEITILNIHILDRKCTYTFIRFVCKTQR